MWIFILTSPVHRSDETAQIVGSQIWYNNIRKKRYLSHKEHPKCFNKEMRRRLVVIKQTDRDILASFLKWEWKVKANILAKPYLRKLETIFERAINKNIQISVISFRHWDKDFKWNLSNKWREQAELLWKKIKEKLKNVNNEDIILASTHNVINVSILKCLNAENTFPNEWMKPLDFTETVKYTFYPSKQNGQPHLEIERKGIKKEIPYEKFKELVKNLTK